jgi:hypothetical protein
VTFTPSWNVAYAQPVSPGARLATNADSVPSVYVRVQPGPGSIVVVGAVVVGAVVVGWH